MVDRIIEFTNLLRRNGLRVSLSENMDAFRALEALGIEDPVLFRSGLRATLVKRAADIASFEELFDLFFLGLGQSIKQSERALMEQLGLTSEQFQELLEQIRQLLEKLDGRISPLLRALLSGEMGQVERLLRAASPAESWQSIVARFGLDGARDELDYLAAMLERLGADAETAEKIGRYAELRLQELNRMIQELLRQESRKKEGPAAQRERQEYLFQKTFSYYTEEDIRKMNEAVVRLAARLKNLLTIRRKRARRGRLAVKDTFRKNLQYGGVPFRIQLDRRKREKPRAIILCDISDSVLNASRFMLQFVYSMQELYSKVRSFVFVSDIGEVTRLFEENEIHQAVEMALRGEVVNVYSHSNFGRAFELFHREYLPAVTSKTTFVIIGDGRNNYNLPNEWVLKEIRLRAKRLIWLNPESRLTWGYGDSEMPRYLPHCDVVEECRNLDQLAKIIDRLVA